MYYEYNNTVIYYEKYGNEKKNILILPGWGETRNTFYKMINYLKKGYTIYIMDYPGFGNSPFPETDITIYDYADIINNFLIKNNIINPIIIAHSFGGRIATILTGKLNLKINKMIFMDVAGIVNRKKLKTYLKEKIYKILKYIIKLLYKKSYKIKIEKLRSHFGSKDYNSLPNNMLTTFRNVINENLINYYEKIKSEVLIIWGEKDIDTPLSDAIIINKRIKNSAIVVFPEGTHFTYLEYSDAVNLIIEKFINEKVSY